MTLDDRLKTELGRLAPTDPSGALERVLEKKVRRRVWRQVRTGVLAVVVVAGSIGGVVALSRVFRTGAQTPATGPVSNGLIAIALASGVPPTEHHLAVIRPDGTDLRMLTSGDALDTEPTWSPDGARIAFWRGGRTQSAGIWVMNADGSDASVLYETDDSLGAIAWSPDGTKIAFVDRVSPAFEGSELDEPNDLLVVNADGTDPQPLVVEGQVTDFSWAPDGARIVLERQTPAAEGRLGHDLSIVDADGTGEVPVTGDGMSMDPTWSPDGSRIAFVASATGEWKERDLFVMDADGSERVRITQGPGAVEDPVWSPDGARIAFTRFPNADGSACELVVTDPEGSAPIMIADKASLGGCPVGLSWQPQPGPATVAPSPTPTETTEPGTDLGLGFPVCNVTALDGIDFLGDGVSGAAWTYAKLADDGTCPERSYGRFFLAADVTGDALADASWGPFEYCGYCEPFGALDLNADGRDELAVLAQESATPQYLLFEYTADGLRPIRVAPPGAPTAALPLGEPVSFSTGGDEGYTGTVACESYPQDPVLVLAWRYHTVEGPGSDVAEYHITRLRLGGDGQLHVVSEANFTRAVGGDLPPPFGNGGEACGLDFDPAAPTP